MRDAGDGIALDELGEIEPGAEMIAFAVKHDGADVVGQCGEKRLDARHHRVVECVAFGGAIKPQNGDRAMPFGLQARRQIGKWRCIFCHRATI